MREQLVSALDSAAHAWLLWMWPMAWQLSVLVLVLGLLTWLLRDRSARLRYALWLLVPIRLVLPPTLALATGWGWWVLPTQEVTVAQAESREPTSAATRNIEIMLDPVVEQQPQMPSQPDAFNPSSTLVVKPRAREIDSQANAISPIEADTLESTNPVVSMTWQSSLFLGWVLGLVLLTIRLTYGLVRTAGMIRRSAVPTRTDVVDLLENCRRRMGLRRSVRVRELADAGVPMLIGVVRPTIILPKDIDCRLRSCELEAVLVHELHHVARHDAFVNLAQTLLGIVYFFHPLVWLANCVLSRLREDACDEATVAVLERQRRDYGSGIVKIAEMVVDRPPSIALGIVGRSGQVKRRLQRILDPNLPLGRRLSWSALALLLVVGAVLLPAAARPGDPAPLTTTETSSDGDSDESRFSPVAVGRSAVRAEAAIDAMTDRAPADELLEFGGTVVDADGKPVAGAEIWCAAPPLDYQDLAAPGNVRHLASSDRQGKFSFRLKQLAGAGLDSANWTYRSQLTAKAAGHGFDWLPLAVFEKNTASSPIRARLQRNVDKLFGPGRFASQTLKLPQEAGPVRGRLLDLEGRPLAGVVVRVENIQGPDITALLEAFETSSSDLYYRSINNRTALGVWITRSEWRALMPAVKTNENGEFSLHGLGCDQMATVTLLADRVAAEQFYILGREMEAKHLPHLFPYPNGPKDVYVGTRFTHAVGPAVPVSGVVTEFKSGKPIANATVFVERLFRESRNSVFQLRLHTKHIRAVTDEQGRYQLVGVPPGEGHVLNVTPPKSEPWLIARQEFSVDSNQASAAVNVQVFRGIWIDGRVTDAATSEPVKGWVDYLALRKNPNIPQKFGLNDWWEIGRFPIDESGHYRVAGLPGPGVVLVHSKGEKTYPLSVGAEKVDGYEGKNTLLPTTPHASLPLSNWHRIQQIDPPVDAQSHTLDLTLSAGASLVGRIVRPEGAPASAVEAQGLVEKNSFFGELMDDTFTVHDYEPAVPRNLFFRTVDNSWVAHLHLEGAPPAELTVTLQPSVTVRGRLIETETGEEAVGYEVHCESSKQGEFRIDDVWATNEEGRFEIKGLLAGNIYKMDSSNVQRFVSQKNRFTVDLTDARPGGVLELGDVTGRKAKSSKIEGRQMSLWNPYQPSSSAPWDLKRALHLHRRVVFGACWDEVQRDLDEDPQRAVTRLLDGTCRSGGVPEEFESLAQTIGSSAVDSGSPERLKAWWLYRCLFSPRPLEERLTLMWHNHFATSNLKVNDLLLMKQQNDTLRKHSCSPFGDLLRALSHDPALLQWLDAPSNRAGMPNENFARELMELFSLGIGNYSEQDVKEGARALTGWTVRQGKFQAIEGNHDNEPKTILNQSGNWTGDDFVRILLEQKSCPRRIAWRLTNEFCGENVVSDQALDELAEGLRKHDLDVRWGVETILRSRLFFSDENIQSRVADPVSFILMPLRGLECWRSPPSTLVLAGWLGRMGQDLFSPPNVGGWTGGRASLSTRTVIARANYATAITSGQLANPARPPETPAGLVGIADPVERMRHLGDLLCGGMNAVTIHQILRKPGESTEPGELLQHCVKEFLTRPEAQLH